MILNTRRNSSPSLSKGRLTSLIAAAAIFAVMALYSAPRMVFAAASPQPAVAASADSAPSTASLAGASGEPGPADPSSAPVVAQSGPASDALPGVSPDPKFKPENPPEAKPEPVAPAAPDVFSVPNGDSMPRPPRAARVPKPPKAPRFPEISDDADQMDGSMEERVKRLEKMVRSLVDQQKHGRLMVYKDGNLNANLDQQKLEQLQQLADMGGDKVSEQKFRELAERQVARAAEQTKRAQEMAKRATKDFEDRLDADPTGKGEFRESLQHQLDALRKAREGLGQEIEKLSHQIEKLERDQQRGEKDSQRRGKRSSGQQQAQDETVDVDH